MLAYLAFCVFMLILPAVLWIVPKTRRNNGNWLIALKTVPAGILAVALTGELLSKIQFALRESLETDIAVPVWLQLVAMLIAAALVIVPGGLFIKRKFGTVRKYNPGPSILLFFLFLPPAFIVFSVIFTGFNIMNRDYRGEWRSSWLPPEGNTKIAFQQQSIHPFLAEYDYRLRFSCDGGKFTRLLFTNCGGRTHFNLYRLKDGRLLFRDKDWDYLVDAPKRQVLMLKPFEGKLYAAEVPNEKIDSWSDPYRKNGKVVVRIGKHTVPADDVTGVLDGMTYYGCILNKFYPASQKPETKILWIERRMKVPPRKMQRAKDPTERSGK